MEGHPSIKRILVVDDEYAIRILLNNFLEGQGFDVRLAEDGQEASRIFKEFQPDLILTDIMMPMENGLSLVARLREINPSIQVIYLSAWLDEAATEKKLHEELRNHPNYKLILQPFYLDNLLETIQGLSSG